MIRRTRSLLPLILSLWAVRAQAATILIVRTAGASATLNETVARLQGELLSLGLAVATVDRAAAGGPGWVEEVAGQRDADAAVEVIGGAAPVAVDIWVFAGQPRRAAVSRVALEPNAENPTQRLAIRAVEALRSSLVEIDLAARRHPAVREPPVAPVAAPARDAGPVDIQVGGALLASLDGVGPALMPLVQVGWTVPPAAGSRSWLVLQAAAAGLGSRTNLASSAGSARIAQQFAVVGACSCVRATRALQPFVALAAGVLRTAIDGQAAAPFAAHAVAQWSFLLEASLGARLRVAGRYHLTLAAHVHVAEPYIAVHLADAVVATSGRPDLLFTLTVGAWL
ncbi:MAG: hypothetical protein ABUS79_24725 [Pseudomonadota bacterium]